MRNRATDFNRSFARTERTVRQVGGCAVFLAIIQVLFYLAIVAGIIYFIAFAITHWLKW